MVLLRTPYRRVIKWLSPNDPLLLGRKLRADLVDSGSGKIVMKTGDRITEKDLPKIAKLSNTQVMVVPFITDIVDYLSADREDKFVIAQANAILNEFPRIHRGSHLLPVPFRL